MPMNVMPPEILDEMQAAARAAMSAQRDPKVMKAACKDMDEISDEIRKKHGVLEIGVSAIREFRDEG